MQEIEDYGLEGVITTEEVELEEQIEESPDDIFETVKTISGTEYAAQMAEFIGSRPDYMTKTQAVKYFNELLEYFYPDFNLSGEDVIKHILPYCRPTKPNGSRRYKKIYLNYLFFRFRRHVQEEGPWKDVVLGQFKE